VSNQDIPPAIREKLESDRAAAETAGKKRYADLAQQLKKLSPNDDPEAIAKARGAAQDRQLVVLEAAQHPNRAGVLRAIDDFSAKLEAAGVRVTRGEDGGEPDDEVGVPPGEVVGHSMARVRLIAAIRAYTDDVTDADIECQELREAAEVYLGGDFRSESHQAGRVVALPEPAAVTEGVVCRGCETVAEAATPGGDPVGWKGGRCLDCQPAEPSNKKENPEEAKRVVVEPPPPEHCADCLGVGHDHGRGYDFCKLWNEMPCDGKGPRELEIHDGRPELCPLRQGWKFVIGEAPEPSKEEEKPEEERARELYEAHTDAVHLHYGGDDIDLERARVPWENVGGKGFWRFLARVAKLREPAP
jgi:hypothetical protein